jgi:hypothetical protein
MGVTHSPLLEPHRTIGAMAPCLGAVVVDKGLFVPRNVDLRVLDRPGALQLSMLWVPRVT